MCLVKAEPRPLSHKSPGVCALPAALCWEVNSSLSTSHVLPLTGSSTTPNTHQASPALGGMDDQAPVALGEKLYHYARTSFLSLRRESRTQQLLLNRPQSLSLASLSLLRPFKLPTGHRAKPNLVHQGLGARDLPEVLQASVRVAEPDLPSSGSHLA